MSSNTITIWAGVVTQDPKLGFTQSGKAYLTLNVGTTKRWKDRDGNKQESRCYHELKLWGKPAEEAAEKAQKLSIVFCRGSLTMETWDDRQTGQKRQKHVVSVEFPEFENLHIFPPREWEERGESQGRQRPPEQRSRAQSRPAQKDPWDEEKDGDGGPYGDEPNW